jgi:DNA-binding NarL/FixJ family response regulator
MKRILIVDDNALFRAALRNLLSHEPDIQVVGEAGSLREAIRSVGTFSPDLVLTDLSMPDTNSIEAVTEIRRHYPDVKILVMSFHRESEYQRRCRKAGAAGYIVKDAIHDELLNCIRIVLSGNTCFDADAPDEMSSDCVNDVCTAATHREDCSV